MTQEDKELLLRDLSARLPYGVKIQVPYEDGSGYFDETVWEVNNDGPFHVNGWGIEYGYVKPYLFPLSSMTEEQRKELIKLINTGQNDNNEFMRSLCRIEFYHKHHFDYRDLIPMGLALDATGLYIY